MRVTRRLCLILPCLAVALACGAVSLSLHDASETSRIERGEHDTDPRLRIARDGLRVAGVVACAAALALIVAGGGKAGQGPGAGR